MAKRKLTNSFCRTVEHSGKHAAINYFDTELRGFLLEVRKTGGKTFHVRYQHNKKTRLKKIGDAAAMTASKARIEAKRIKNEIDLGKDIYTEKQIIKNTPTLNEFYNDYYLPHIKQRKRSWETDISIFSNHILPSLGELSMSNITRYMVCKIHADLSDKGLKPATANKIPVFLRSAFNLAIKWEITGVTTNPVSNFELFEENNKVERYLSKDETAKLMVEVAKSENKLLKYIVTFLILTGARRNEALHAKWEHIDLLNRIWTIPLSKSGKSHHVPITDGLVNLLRSIPRQENSEYLFPTKAGKPFVNIYNSWHSARKRAGLADVRLHDLRHTFASTLVNSGRTLYEVQMLLGHHNISVTQRYAHLSHGSLLEAANCATNLLPQESAIHNLISVN